MQSAAISWTIFTSLTGLIWLLRHLVLSRVAKVLPPLKADSDGTGNKELPPLTMLVAGKDEEANIERCIRSLLAQTYPRLSIIAINDRSADRTPEILDRLAREDSRLTVIHVRELREGWFGKNNAMREGCERAATPWMCFTDADCTFRSPHALTTAMKYARDHNVDFLSVLPVLDVQSMLEQVFQPACAGILLIWFNPLFVNNPRRRTAYANGAFMLMTRAAYERIGGHEPVKTEVNEDVHMARRAKAAGLRLRVVGNQDLYCVRMYANFGQIWRGWSRIFYGCFGSLRRILLSMLAVSLVGIQPWVTLLAGGLLMQYTASPATWIPVFWAGLIASAMQLSVMIRYYRAAQIPVWLAPTYPFAATIALGMLASAIRRLGGKSTTTWRGTTYRADKVVRPIHREQGAPR